MLKLEKKQVKIISLAVALFFVLGIIGIALSQSGKSYASGSGASSNVGVVNSQALFEKSPDAAKAQQDMQAAIDQAKKDYDEKSQAMSTNKEKQEYMQQLQQGLAMKEKELMEPVQQKIEAVIKEVAAAKGLTVVLDKNNVVFGGQDITEDVAKKLAAK